MHAKNNNMSMQQLENFFEHVKSDEFWADAVAFVEPPPWSACGT